MVVVNIVLLMVSLLNITAYSPLASSLDENTDAENLAGHHLTITERDGSRKTLQKAASFVRSTNLHCRTINIKGFT